MTLESMPIACLLTDAEQAQRRENLSQSLFRAAQERRALPDGVAFRFASDRKWLSALVEFVASERECCPFLFFEVRAGPGLAPLWLHVRGESDAAIEFVRSAFTALDDHSAV